MRTWLAMAAIGCGRLTDPSGELAALDGGWIEAVGAEPDTFSGIVGEGASRAAWVAIHEGDLSTASAADGPAGWRGRTEAARVERDLALLSEAAWPLWMERWSDGPGLPIGTALPALVALSAHDAGLGEDAQAALARLDPWATPEAQALAAAIDSGQPFDSLQLDATGGMAPCLSAHQAARAARDPAPLAACVGPLWVEADGKRALHDPLQHATRVRILAAPPPAGVDGFTQLLFSGDWACSEAAAPNCAAPAPLAAPAAGADPQAEIARLDDLLERWKSATLDDLPEEGRALITDLRLIEGFRAGRLARWARAALDAGAPDRALVFLRAARDHQAPRTVGPTNPPELFSLQARAHLSAGRPREALDALQPLAAGWPHSRALTETIGDIAVLDTLSRRGDSKER